MRSRRTCWEVRGTLSQSRWTLQNAAHPIRTSSSRSMKKTRLASRPKGRKGGTRPCPSPFTRSSPWRVLIEPIPKPHFPTPPPSSAAFTYTPLAPCSLSLAPYAVYGTQHEPFVRAAREAQRPCQAHYAFVPRLHARLHGLRLRSSNFQRPTRHGCDPHTHRALVALAVAAWYVQLRRGSARGRWRGARWAAG